MCQITKTESQTQDTQYRNSRTEQSADLSRLELRLFGAPQILLNGEAVMGLSTKEQALLFYLAVTQQPHLRTSVATLLWGEQPDSNARTSLRRAIHNLRKALPDHMGGDLKSLVLNGLAAPYPGVPSSEQPNSEPPSSENPSTDAANQQANSAGQSRESVGNPDAGEESPASGVQAVLWVDVVDFVDKSERMLAAEAVELYRADLLQGFSVPNAEEYETWQSGQREHLRKLLISNLRAASQLWFEQGKADKAIPAAQRALQLDLWNEEAQRQLMRMLALSGQRHNAVVQYESFRQTLQADLGVEPSPQTVALYQQIRNGDLDQLIDQPDDKMTGWPDDKMTAATPHPVTPSSPHLVMNAPHLFGVDDAHDNLVANLVKPDRPWLLSIDGIGGIGKTSLAQLVVSTLTESQAGDGPAAHSDRFSRIAWVSAKQEEFQAGIGIKSTEQAALDVDRLIEELLEQLSDRGLAPSAQERELELTRLLKEQPTLVVIDNLETVADYEALIPTLRRLVNPSKVLITSRHTLVDYEDIYCLTLGELTEDDAEKLLRHEATMRGIRGIREADPDTMKEIRGQIMQVVGGHPLALNLVLGQLSFLPLEQVLTNLKEASGHQTDEFYTYIYWQAWQALERSARELFMAMPMLYNASYDRLAAISELDDDALQASLAQLIGLSLVQISGDLLEPRYRLHRLTETFLLNEVLKWNV